MRYALIAFFFFIVVALASGTVKMPTGEDITLLIASLSLLVIALFKRREKKDGVGQKGQDVSAVPDKNK